MIGPPVVRLQQVSKSFGSPEDLTPVLRGVDLTIMPREKASLVGPSGSGKSTLLSLIAGLLRPTEGTVEIDGVGMSSLDDRHRAQLRAQRIGIALQADNLIPFLSARENVELAHVFAQAVEMAQPTIDSQGQQLIVSLPARPLWVNVDVTGQN